MVYIGLWIGIFSFISFLLFRIDKIRAKTHRRRIPEATLLLSALLGGAVGGLLGMQVFRHKTRKIKFILGLPLCLILNSAAAYVLLRILE